VERGGDHPVWRVAFTNGLSSFAVSGAAPSRRSANHRWRSQRGLPGLERGRRAELWATNLDSAYYPNGGVGYDDGPRTTPSVQGGSVFVLSSYLKLYRLNATNGAVIWQRTC